MIFIIRHGERADDGMQYEKNSVQLEFDPALTQTGHQQSIKTGLYISDQIKQYNLNGIYIISSPFLRCVQTTQGILKNIPPLNNTVYTAFGFGEFYKENWFTSDILDQLTIYQHNGDQQFDDINLKHLPYEQIRQQYPETLQDFFGRFAENYKRMKEYFLPILIEKQYGLVLITHGFGIHAIYNFENKFQHMDHINYCSISIFKYFYPIQQNSQQKKQSKPQKKIKLEIIQKNYINHLNAAHL